MSHEGKLPRRKLFLLHGLAGCSSLLCRRPRAQTGDTEMQSRHRLKHNNAVSLGSRFIPPDSQFVVENFVNENVISSLESWRRPSLNLSWHARWSVFQTSWIYITYVSSIKTTENIFERGVLSKTWKVTERTFFLSH